MQVQIWPRLLEQIFLADADSVTGQVTKTIQDCINKNKLKKLNY